MWDTHWMRTRRWTELKALIEGLDTRPMGFAPDGLQAPVNRVQQLVYGPRIQQRREQLRAEAEAEARRTR